jgi:hypothetical protein
MPRIVKNRLTRPHSPPAAPRSRAFGEDVRSFIDGKPFCLFFGGTGDGLLCLASAMKHPEASIVGMVNPASNALATEVMRHAMRRFRFWDNNFGSEDAASLIRWSWGSGLLRPSGHLPVVPTYDDWLGNFDFYAANLARTISLPTEPPKARQPYCIVCPAGSVRSEERRRHLSLEELLAVIRKRRSVWLTGSPSDVAEYGPAIRECAGWMTANSTYRHGLPVEHHGVGRLLGLADAANEVISTDTWLKTYTLLRGKETKVILNRVNGQYVPPGCNDSSDAIFLNHDLWPKIRQVRVEELT